MRNKYRMEKFFIGKIHGLGYCKPLLITVGCLFFRSYVSIINNVSNEYYKSKDKHISIKFEYFIIHIVLCFKQKTLTCFPWTYYIRLTLE